MELYHQWLCDGSPDGQGETDAPAVDTSSEGLESDSHEHDASANGNSLLSMCDNARASLQATKTMGSTGEQVMAALGNIVKDEYQGQFSITLDTIKFSRLDKLLEDLICRENRPMPTPAKIRADISIAESLQRQWRSRLRQKYFDIDQLRLTELPLEGGLKDIVFNPEAQNSRERWQVHAGEESSEIDANTPFEVGYWWLHLACARRDGMVGTVNEMPTKQKYGTATLPLMTGREELHWPGSTVKYSREGQMSDMLIPLMSQVGSQIKVLRGHRLKSALAPKAGIRYDGLYILRQYGQKENPLTGLHKVVLSLERVEEQQPMQELVRIPRPSQLDDWELFQKYEGDMVKQAHGEQGFLDWKLEKAQQRMDQEQWRHTMQLGQELNLARLTREVFPKTADYGAIPEQAGPEPGDGQTPFIN